MHNTEIQTESKLLNSLVTILPILSKITGVDMQITLCSTDTVIAGCQAENFSLPGAAVDVPLVEDNPAHKNIIEVIRTGRGRVDILPKEMMGITVRGIVSPLIEDGRVVGAIVCATSLQEMDTIKESSTSLFENLTQAQDVVKDVAGEAVNLADKIGKIEEASSDVTVQISKAKECISAIQNNSGRSNILALNGSIEAARMGEAGRGFAVIAQEMRKFSQVSTETANSIIEAINEVSDLISEIKTNVDDVNNIATNQAASTEEVTASLDDITTQASKIVDYIKF